MSPLATSHDAAPLIAVAHGSRDPRSAKTIELLLERVRGLNPRLPVYSAFLDLSEPDFAAVLDTVAGQGYQRAIVVPLLLGHAYHASQDVPRAVAAAQQRWPNFTVSVSGVLGAEPGVEAPGKQSAAARVERAVSSRLLEALAEAGVDPQDPELGVLLAGAGSAQESANQLVRDVAARWSHHQPWTGVAATFAAAAQPDVPTAVAELRTRGARKFALGLWFLAPGRLPDRAIDLARETTVDIAIAEPIGPDVHVAELVLERYAAACSEGVTALV